MPRIRAICLALALVLVASAAHASIRAASWNVRHLGWENGKDLNSVAAVINRFDLVAIEEVMDLETVERLADKLSALSGDDWGRLGSRAIGRGSYKEHYAFVWRKSAVSFEGGATVYLDPGDIFARQPLSAMFSDREDGKRFVFAAVHILYGDGPADRTPEIRALADYWEWLESSFDAPVVVAGDFNMTPDHSAWRALGDAATPLIRRGATTLSSYDNRYANLYDNIWVRPGQLEITSSGIARFPNWLAITHKQARKYVSDHAPVYFTLGSKRVDTSTFAAAVNPAHPADGQANASTNEGCIDLNAGSVKELERLDQVGPSRARAIISHRPYEAIDGLRAVRGLGMSRVADIRQAGNTCPL